MISLGVLKSLLTCGREDYELLSKFNSVKNRYTVIFAIEGVAIGMLLYLALRQTIRHFIDVSQVIPQFPYVDIVANVIGLGVILPLVVFAAISVTKNLGLDKA